MRNTLQAVVVICGVAGCAALARADDLKIGNKIVSIFPLVAQYGADNKHGDWGPRANCATGQNLPLWLKFLNAVCRAESGYTPNQKLIYREINKDGGAHCGYSQFAVACVYVH